MIGAGPCGANHEPYSYFSILTWFKRTGSIVASAWRDRAAGVSRESDFIVTAMDMRETWELLSYVVTVLGLPLAILVFIYEQRKELQNEEDLG